MKFNKGEWAEAYTFIKLIAEGKVHASDENLKRIDNKIYPILKVFKDEIKRFYTDEKGTVNIIDYDGNIISSRNTSEFIKIADESLNLIKEGRGSSFEVPLLKNFLNKIGIENFKGSSAKKEDIKLEILDLELNEPQTLTFTIKSHLGSKPTLLNASDLTNFLFEIKNISKDEMESLNNINKNTNKKWLKTRFNLIYERYIEDKYDISLVDEKEKIFYQNLRLIDSNLPNMISYILLYFYSHEKSSDLSLLTDKLTEFNPLNLEKKESEVFYKKKIIDLIESITFGMMPNDKWDGNYEISGGLLTVKKNGEILCHHIFYDNDSLKKYLFNNTILETPSTTRHKYGDLFEENGKIFFKLNLQLRVH